MFQGCLGAIPDGFGRGVTLKFTSHVFLDATLAGYIRLGQILYGESMDILTAIKREERKLEKQLGKLQHELNGIRAAAKTLGDSTSREVETVKKRVLSAAARARIGKAAKRRWAKFRAQTKKVAG